MTIHPKVAAVQHCAGTDVEANLSTLEMLTRDAVSAGAVAVCWPEAFAYLGRHDGKLDILEPLPGGGPILKRCQDLARTQDCELLLGGFHETVPGEPTRCFNTSVYLDAKGEIKALYRKIHLFDVNIPNGPALQESRHTSAGDHAHVVNTRFGSLGLSICYDIRFPMLYQHLVDLGATSLTVPSAFTATTGAKHWHILLRARAIEAQSYVIAPAQHGAHSKHRTSYGHSLIVDPTGTIVAELADGDGYVMAEIAAGLITQTRTELPSLANRQPFK